MATQEQEQERRRSLPAVGGPSVLTATSYLTSPQYQRKRRSHVPRAAPSRWWGFTLPAPVPPPAPPATRTKRGGPCAMCGAGDGETPRWRTWPTDARVALCNACGILVRKPGAALPELVYLPHLALPKQVHVRLPPPPAAAAAAAELQQPHQPEIQESESESESPPDSPTLDDSTDADEVYLVRRTFPRPRREKSSSPPPPPSPPPAPAAEPAAPAAAAAAPAPGKKRRCCVHCGSTTTAQWRTGPAGEGTLCNPCGVCYQRGRLVPEYRPRASPSYDAAVHSNEHRAVARIRRQLDHPAPPATYRPVRAGWKRRRDGGEGRQQPAQVRRKRGVGKKKKQQQAPEPAAATQPRASDEMEEEEHLPTPPTELPHTAGNVEMEQHLPPPPPPAQPYAGEELMVEEPMPLLDPVLFNDGPAAPIFIEDDEPVVVNMKRRRFVIVISDDDD